MIKKFVILASVLTVLLAAPMAKRVVLENQRITASEVVYEPGKPREPYIRPTDQVIVFLDECTYERLDSQTNEKSIAVTLSLGWLPPEDTCSRDGSSLR